MCNNLPEGCSGIYTDEKEPINVEVTVSITMSKTFTISTTNYEEEVDVDEDGPHLVTTPGCLYDDVYDQIYLPNNLALVVKAQFENDLDLKAARMNKYLRDALEDCSHWTVDDMEVIPE